MTLGRFKCPSCAKPLYTRRTKKCPNCKKPLPDNLLLSPKAQSELDAETDKIKARGARLKKESEPAKPWNLP